MGKLGECHKVHPFQEAHRHVDKLRRMRPNGHLRCEAAKFSDWRVPPGAFGPAEAQRRERRKMWPHSGFVKLLEGGRTKDERRWDRGRLDILFFEHVKPIASGPVAM